LQAGACDSPTATDGDILAGEAKVVDAVTQLGPQAQPLAEIII